ncbi:MAG: TauD/TfdA family dioxygenase [Alphaproteobacteria bacterium]|nr:TauD/TfdA family dioxygenase [Alphaproteobacteria bacterium]
MATTQRPDPVTAPWVWSSREILDRDDWIVELDETARRDLDAALGAVKRGGLALERLTAADFPLPSMAESLARTKRLLGDGPGLALIRGFPVDRYDRDEMALILWGVGCHLGIGMPQSYRGDMIGDVMDMSHTGDTRRSYRSPRALDLHCDPVDVVGLLCLRRAREGGASLLTSSLAVHNAILAARPDLLPALYRGYHYRHSEAASLGEPATTLHRIPVFGVCGGRVVCNFNASPIGRSLAEDGRKEDAAALEAFEVFKATTRRQDLMVRTMLEPGDLQLLNNRAVLHGRTLFGDHDDITRKRLMLRLWLRIPDWPALPDTMMLHKDGRARARVGAAD